MNAKSVVVTIDRDAAGSMVRPMCRVTVDGVELQGVTAVNGNLEDLELIVTTDDGQERRFPDGTFEIRYAMPPAYGTPPGLEIVEPHWLDVTSPGSEFEEQLDARAHPFNPRRMRHRKTRYTDEEAGEWIVGPAPREYKRLGDGGKIV